MSVLALTRSPECAVRPVAGNTASLPRRPDATVLSEAIPLFYLGQNAAGFWVVRESRGECGGVFMFRRSAENFARQRSAPRGCATMLLNEPLELDLENEGSGAAGAVDAIRKNVARRAPWLWAFVADVIAEARKLGSEISRAFASARKHRAAIERELFRGQYRLSSKNDDDLPIP